MSQAQPPSRRAIILAGPTASGKTALAIKLAQRHNGVIINADSMQVYAGIPILTAAPDTHEMQRAPHRLFGYIDPASACSVGRWIDAARIATYETWQEGKLPIFVGGTGMYIRALMQGISPIPDVSGDIREAVRALPVAEAYAWLRAHDPDMAARLETGDTQRILRAVEVLRQTGQSLLHWQAIPPQAPLPDAAFELYSLSLPRELLYQRCDLRLEHMLKQGALDELRDLLARNLPADMPAMRAVGIPELTRHLRGEWTLEHALTKAQQATRNYAKRQLTWLRNQFPDVHRIQHPYDDLPAALR
jgi:tRNA dimethylallyltransferase